MPDLLPQATLGVDPKKGRTVLFAEVDGAKHVLCALTTGTHEMAPLDLMFGLPQKVRICTPLCEVATDGSGRQ